MNNNRSKIAATLCAMLILFAGHLKSQTKKSDNQGKDRTRDLPIGIHYGQMIFSRSPFKELSTFGTYRYVSSAPVVLGLQIPNQLRRYSGTYNYRRFLTLAVVLPTAVSYDSLRYTLSGWILNTSVVTPIVLKKSKIVTLKAGLGLSFGALYLKGSEIPSLRNGFFAPHLNFYNGYKLFKRLEPGIAVIYAYDVSRSAWKKRGQIYQGLPGFAQHALQVSFMLSWYFL